MKTPSRFKKSEDPFSLLKEMLKDLGYEDLPLSMMKAVAERLTGLPLSSLKEVEQKLSEIIAKQAPKL